MEGEGAREAAADRSAEDGEQQDDTSQDPPPPDDRSEADVEEATPYLQHAPSRHDVSPPEDFEPSSMPDSDGEPPEVPQVQVEPPPESEQPSVSSRSSIPPSPRSRTDSSSTTATSTIGGSTQRSSLVFVIGALELIASSKDAQKKKQLKDSTQYALEQIKTQRDPQSIDPKILFEPLRLATEANAENVVKTALDCIGKLISYSYFSMPSEQSSHTSDSLIDQAIDTICDCFEGEATSDGVQLQIIISLLSAVLNDKVVVHGSGLLKAVRQMYNIFLHSKNTQNQSVAQTTLAQMVGTVFERAKTRIAAKEARLNLGKVSRPVSGSIEQFDESRTSLATQDIEPVLNGHSDEVHEPYEETEIGTKMTLQTFERRGSFDDKDVKEGPTTVTAADEQGGRRRRHKTADTANLSEEDAEDEIYMKDAFLVFRAMCKISIKPLRPEEVADLRSQGSRAKLLSLHIIHNALFNHMALFMSPFATILSSSNNEPTQFTSAIKQLLCQTLSRNGASSVNRVYEVGCEVFWLMVKHLRVLLKKEVEVFFKEIYFAILDNRNAPSYQKQCFLNVLERMVADPRILVELYLNYDCDRTAADNLYQRTIEHLSRMASSPVTITSLQQHAYQTQHAKKSTLADWQTRGTVPPSLSTAAVTTPMFEQDTGYPQEYAMKQQSLECMVQTLRSLVHWAQQSVLSQSTLNGEQSSPKVSAEYARDSGDGRPSLVSASPFVSSTGFDSPAVATPLATLADDDPLELERAKQKKTALSNAVRQFNFKPKKGLKVLLESGFINDRSPQTIANFLLSNESLDKAALGEFLGEGDQENVDIMHAFVDAMDFNKTRFVDALRRFLQSFRLPGEAQKIDRFMLKFAERYISGNPNAFANADTAYVLAYSVIMLNTDQHSSKLKGPRMTPEDFIKNNRGINDNADLPDEYLRGIFDQITHNEIVLDTEQAVAANLGRTPQPTGGFASNIGQALANAGRDLQREAFALRSEEMANKTEQLFKSLVRQQRRGSTKGSITRFIPATSFKHVGPMFEITWTPFLTALTGCAQDTNNLETVRLCMDGLKLAIQISCYFDLEDPRSAFVASISRFTNLYNLSEMKAKNVEALRVLLDVAHSEGNMLKESWRDILTTVSQLDRFQLISQGVSEKALPDVLRSSRQPAPSRTNSSRQSLQVPSKHRSRPSIAGNYRSEIAEESRSASIVMGVDRIFTNTAKLSGDAIVHFTKALTQVSWQEIESSGQSQEPRTYSLQKLVEIGEYNMDRVRFEWTMIWQVLGEHFNQVGCHTNTKVVHFAMNCLRQLSIRFLDLEELPGFKFQKDFLKPFAHIINNTSVVQVKELVLHSLIQMIQARGDNIRSGWRTIFGVFTVAARERSEAVVNLAYDNVIQIYHDRFGVIIAQGAFADLAVCLTEFSKNARFQKKSLQSIETLKAITPRMLKTPECPLSQQPSTTPRQPSHQTREEQYWFPVLFAFHDVLMTGDDLEVRSRALNYLFDTLVKYGADFPREFWDTVWRQLLYPIFMVLKSKQELNRVVNHEELSVWLSTTMIQALRNMISLFTHYFESLEYMIDRFLDLLALCICQENDTLARIGSNCLQTLILQNVYKFQHQHWVKIVSCFVDLFNRTEATALFSAAVSSQGSAILNSGGSLDDFVNEDPTSMGNLGLSNRRMSRRSSQNSKPSMSRTTSDSELPNGHRDQSPAVASPTEESQTPGLEDFSRPDPQIQQAPVVVTAARRRFFNQLVTKCILQLLMIETVNELFSNDSVYTQIPSSELLRLMSLLKKSYHFAKRFNDDHDLRNRLFQEGFMRSPPNLLKQESGSASVYVNILFRMYHDEGAERRQNREAIESALIPLCIDIIESYTSLKEETQQRNIMTWRPVVIDVVDGYANFPVEGFAKHAATFAPLLTALMGREIGMELQRAVQALVQRILELHYDMPPLEQAVPVPSTPMSPRASVFNSRRTSRASRT